MIRLVVRGRLEPVAAEFAKLHRPSGVQHGGTFETQQAGPTARVLGPAPCPFARLKGNTGSRFRFKAPTASSSARPSRQATADLEPPDDVQWIVDVDPVDML